MNFPSDLEISLRLRPRDIGKFLGRRGCTTQYILPLGSVRIQYVIHQLLQVYILWGVDLCDPCILPLFLVLMDHSTSLYYIKYTRCTFYGELHFSLLCFASSSSESATPMLCMFPTLMLCMFATPMLCVAKIAMVIMMVVKMTNKMTTFICICYPNVMYGHWPRL